MKLQHWLLIYLKCEVRAKHVKPNCMWDRSYTKYHNFRFSVHLWECFPRPEKLNSTSNVSLCSWMTAWKKAAFSLEETLPAPSQLTPIVLKQLYEKQYRNAFFSALMLAGAIEVAFRLLSYAARKIFCEREWRHRLCFPAVSRAEQVCSKNYTYSLHLPFLLSGVRLKQGKKAFRIAFIRSCPCLLVDLVYFPHSTLCSGVSCVAVWNIPW